MYINNIYCMYMYNSLIIYNNNRYMIPMIYDTYDMNRLWISYGTYMCDRYIWDICMLSWNIC